MKDRTLIYLSLILSLAAIGYSAWVHNRADQMAVEALRKREIELVTHYTPILTQVYSDMGGHSSVFTKPPQTIEDLFRPMAEILDRLSDSKDKTAPKNEVTK